MRVEGAGLRVQGAGFRVQGSGFGVSGLYMDGGVAGRKEEASQYRLHRLGFRVDSFVLGGSCFGVT